MNMTASITDVAIRPGVHGLQAAVISGKSYGYALPIGAVTNFATILTRLP
jgi:hypothetical protein